MSAKPRSGVRVLDLTRLLRGPAATMHFADLDGDVIEIENPSADDYARHMGLMRGETSGLFQLVNRNKRGLRLDLKQPQGIAVLLRRVRDADVVIEVDGVKQFAPPFKIDGMEFVAPRGAPLAGADSEALLRDTGYSLVAIDALRDMRVI